MSDKFLGSGQGSINLSNGSATIYSATLGAASLAPSRALKTNSVKQLISSNLDISDVNNLSTELQEKDELLFVENDVHTIPDPGKIKIYAKTDNNLYKLDDLGNETGFGGAGDVVGPSTSDDYTIAFFDGTTGKLLKENVGFKFQTGLTYGDQLNVPDIETADHFSLNRELDKINNIVSAVEVPAPYTVMAGTLDVKTVASALNGGELDFDTGTATLDSNAIILSSKLGNINSIGTFTMNQPSTFPPSYFQKLKFEFGTLFNLIRSEGDGILAGNLNQLFIDASQINIQSPLQTTQTVFTSPQELVSKKYVDDNAVGTTTLQQAYVASGSNPLDAKIDIDNTRFGIQIRNTTGASSNTCLQITNNLGDNRWAVDGFGSVSKNRLNATHDLKQTHSTNSIPKFSSGLFAGDENYKIYNETTASYPLNIDALGNNISTIGNLTINQPSNFPGTYYQKLKFDFGTLYNVIRSEGNTDGGLARLDIDASEVNIGINNLNKIAITSLETTISNDLKTDIIIKNTNDNVNIEGSQFRTGGLVNINELQIVDAIDAGSNVISSVSNGIALTDAVNKQQLDTKIDLTQKGAVSGVCPLDGTQKIANQYLPDLAITQVYVVADNTARDNIASVQSGDVAVVLSPPNNFIWNGPDETAPLTPANWVQLVVPTGTVTSVNGASGSVSLTTDNIPETLSNPYFTDLRRDELINRSGTVAMVNNLNMDDNNIVNCNTVENAGGDLTLQSNSNTVQIVSGNKINLNCSANVEIPNCDLDMLTNEITNASVITTGALQVVSIGSGVSPNINVFNNLSMSGGANIEMNGNNITNAGVISLDALSSATATNIQVNHDLEMNNNDIENVNTLVLNRLNTFSAEILCLKDINMITRKVKCGTSFFDFSQLVIGSGLPITLGSGLKLIDNTIDLVVGNDVSVLKNIDMNNNNIIDVNTLDSSSNLIIRGGTTIQHQTAGTYFNGLLGADTNLFVNNVLQDTGKDVFCRRSKNYPSIPIPLVGPGVSSYGVGAPRILEVMSEQINFNTDADTLQHCSVQIPITGLYKIDFSADVSSDNDGCEFQFELRIGGVIKKTCTMKKQKDRIVTSGLTSIEPVTSAEIVEIFVRVDTNILFVYNYNMTVQRLRTNA